VTTARTPAPARLRSGAATGAWSFVLVGLIGLVDVALEAVRSGWPEPTGPLGPAGPLLASFALYGWCGLAVAALVYPLALLLATRRGRRGGDEERSAAAYALAASLSLVLVVCLGHLVGDTPAGAWWTERVGPVWPPLVFLAGVATLVLAVPLRRAAARLAGASRVRLAVLLAIAALASLSWPVTDAAVRRRHVAATALGTAPADARNVVLLCVDALRRDKLGCLAEGAPPTPHLDRLAARSRLFTNAWSVTSWTLPSVATVMTGLPPRALAVADYLGLPPSIATLAERARRAGWWTKAVVANPYLVEDLGFSRGFADFDHADALEALAPARSTVLAQELTRHILSAHDAADGEAMVVRVGRWLRTYRRDEPFLCWIHLMEPHVPYRNHPDQAGRRPELPAHPLLDGDGFADLAALRAALPDVPPPVRQAIEDLYDGEVRRADLCVGRLLDALAASGHADDTWIIVFADHGEEFFEHSGCEHGHSLLPEVSGIPLLVCPPGGLAAGVRDGRPVSLLDLLPSLRLALGWSAPDSLPGRPSLVQGRDGRLAAPSGPIVLEGTLYGPPQDALLRWPDFQVRDLRSGVAVWYDLATDPGATTPVPAPVDAEAVDLRRGALIAAWDAIATDLEVAGRARVTLDERAQRRLRSLGY